MRLYKIICTSIFITLMAMGYVHQHVEIVKAGYGLQKNRKQLEYLDDQNAKLIYDLSKMESPRNLLTSLDNQQIEFVKYRNKGANSYKVAYADTKTNDKEGNFIVRLLDIFTPSAVAHPKE